jgi:hypothetical protein
MTEKSADAIEIEAMATIYTALCQLDYPAQARVLNYFEARHIAERDKHA